jgi:hypothetical protein
MAKKTISDAKRKYNHPTLTDAEFEERASTSSNITTKIIPRGRWRSYPLYKQVADAFSPWPFDVHVMNVFDNLCPGRRGPEFSFWRMTTTSNGGFYLRPEQKETITMVSPMGKQAELSEEGAGIVATLYSVNGAPQRAGGDLRQRELLCLAGVCVPAPGRRSNQKPDRVGGIIMAKKTIDDAHHKFNHPTLTDAEFDKRAKAYLARGYAVFHEDGSIAYDPVSPIWTKLIAAARELHGLGVAVEDMQKRISGDLREGEHHDEEKK